MRLLVTGATGYIGRAFVDHACAEGARVIALTRTKPEPKLPCMFVMPSSWSDEALLAKAMEGCDAVVHLAGLAHGKSGDMRSVNHDLPLTLAHAAIKAGVPRFIFVSSAAVFGGSGRFGVDDTPRPETEYGLTKYEAERNLRALLENTTIKLHIARPPAVIGPNAPGHAEAIRRYAQHLLPFGDLHAKRSYIGIDDMVQFLYDLASERDEAPALWHVSAEPVTATELIRKMAAQDNIALRLFSVPSFLLKLTGVKSLKPLVEDHVLIAGRRELNGLV